MTGGVEIDKQWHDQVAVKGCGSGCGARWSKGPGGESFRLEGINQQYLDFSYASHPVLSGTNYVYTDYIPSDLSPELQIGKYWACRI